MAFEPLKNPPTNDADWHRLVDDFLRRKRAAKRNSQLKARKSAAKSKRPKQRHGPRTARRQRNAQRRDR